MKAVSEAAAKHLTSHMTTQFAMNTPHLMHQHKLPTYPVAVVKAV